MTVRVHIEEHGIDQLVHGPETRALVSAMAKALAREAAHLAPHRTGHLRASYHSTPARPSAFGVVASAYTDDFAGHMAEWGSINNPPYAPLRRAAGRLGFVVIPYPKGSG